MKYSHKPMIGVASLSNLTKAKALPYSLLAHEKIRQYWDKYKTNPLTKTRAQIILNEWGTANIEKDEYDMETRRFVQYAEAECPNTKALTIVWWHATDGKGPGVGYMRHWDKRLGGYTINFFQYDAYIPMPTKAIAEVCDIEQPKATEAQPEPYQGKTIVLSELSPRDRRFVEAHTVRLDELVPPLKPSEPTEAIEPEPEPQPKPRRSPKPRPKKDRHILVSKAQPREPELVITTNGPSFEYLFSVPARAISAF